MWNPFEVLLKQRLKLLLLPVKKLPTLVPYLFLLICVSNVAGNLFGRLIILVHSSSFTIHPWAGDFLPAVFVSEFFSVNLNYFDHLYILTLEVFVLCLLPPF
jgi:hypothetical protein